MSMVTTAVAMLSGTMQTAVVSKSNDKGKEDTKSFAESIGERMQQDTNVETKTEVNRGLAVPPMPKDGTPVSGGNQPAPDGPHPPVNGSGALGQAPGNAEAVKAGINMYQPAPFVQNGLDRSGNNANLTAATEADTAIAAPGKTGEVTVTDGIDKAGNEASSDTIGQIVDGGPTAAENSLQTASVTNSTLLQAEAEESQQTVGPHDEKGATAGKAGGEVLAGPQEASTKKVVRKHTSTEKKATPKDASAVGIAAGVAQCVGTPGIQSATPVQASVTASVTMTRVQSGESQAIKGTSAQGSSAGTVSTGQQNSEVRAATGAGKDSKADAAKVPADALKIAEPFAVDAGTTPKTGLGTEKTSVSAQAGAGNTDAKSQGITAPPVSAHALAGASVASGLSGGVVLAQAIAGAASTKTQSGEAGVQLAATHAGAGERNISGAPAMPSPTSSSHRTLFATPTVLEVGVPNGTQGWLKIRAEMAGGGAINASLSAASPGGQEMLHRELPSLTAYLQQERIAVNAVVVHEAAARTLWGGPSGGLSGGMSGQLQQRSGQGGDSQRAATGAFMRATGFDGRDLSESNELSLPAPYAGSGNWLSVRA